MKIRTRLFLFFLPALATLVALIPVLLSYNLYHQSFPLIAVSVGLTGLVMIATLWITADRISGPIQKLNNSALAIAAGKYGEAISSEGPKEIAELANTLNIMSECLLENINRLKENALLRERMYGEYECAMLLQHLMLQKNIDDCRSDAIAVKAITFFSDDPHGILLDFPKSESRGMFHIRLAEANEKGFEGMYQLLTKSETAGAITLSIDSSTSTLKTEGAVKPFVWSIKKKRFVDFSSSSMAVQSGDFFFLFNQGFPKLYKEPSVCLNLLSKVLKVFAQEGPETVAAMIRKEISFLLKKKDLKEDLHLICFQILKFPLH